MQQSKESADYMKYHYRSTATEFELGPDEKAEQEEEGEGVYVLWPK